MIWNHVVILRVKPEESPMEYATKIMRCFAFAQDDGHTVPCKRAGRHEGKKAHSASVACHSERPPGRVGIQLTVPKCLRKDNIVAISIPKWDCHGVFNPSQWHEWVMKSYGFAQDDGGVIRATHTNRRFVKKIVLVYFGTKYTHMFSLVPFLLRQKKWHRKSPKRSFAKR